MKKLLGLTNRGLSKTKRAFACVSSVFTLALYTVMPASAATSINDKATTSSVVGGILDVVFNIALYLGIVIAVIGIVSFILAFKDDNAESQSRGIRLAIVGTALIGIKVLIKMTGLIK